MLKHILSSYELSTGSLALILLGGAAAALLVFVGGWLMIIHRPSEKHEAAVRRSKRTKVLSPRPVKRTKLAIEPRPEPESWSALPSTAAWRAPPVAIDISDERGMTEPIGGWIVDRSPDGLCIEVGRDILIPPDTIVTIHPCNASPTIPWVALKVIDSRQVGRGWELECRYLRTPVWSVRMLFG